MPKILITVTAQATITEEWTLKVTARQAIKATRDRHYALDLIAKGGRIISVEDAQTDDEHDREVVGVQIL